MYCGEIPAPPAHEEVYNVMVMENRVGGPSVPPNIISLDKADVKIFSAATYTLLRTIPLPSPTLTYRGLGWVDLGETRHLITLESGGGDVALLLHEWHGIQEQQGWRRIILDVGGNRADNISSRFLSVDHQTKRVMFTDSANDLLYVYGLVSEELFPLFNFYNTTTGKMTYLTRPTGVTGN